MKQITIEDIKAVYEAGDYIEAERISHIFSDINPDNAEGWIYMGVSERHLNKYTKSIDSFTKSLSLDESNWITWSFRGDSFYDNGEYDKAFNDFWYCLQLNPNEGAVMDKCARSLYRIGRHEYALELIQKTIDLQEDVTPYIIKAHMLNMLERHKEAEATLDEALSVFPQEIEDVERYRKEHLLS